MRILFLITLAMCVQNASAKVESSRPIKDNVSFDITFWQKQLHLSEVQLWELRSINRDMYLALYELAKIDYRETSDFCQLMLLWRTASMEVLSERQKKRWRKLMDKYGVDNRQTLFY